MVMPRDPGAVEHALEGLVALDAYLIAKHNLPPLLKTGARYQTEDKEQWRSALEVIGEGWGDCEDLAAYRCGELRARIGEPARLILRWTGPKTMHALVLRASGKIEDPSRALGMKG